MRLSNTLYRISTTCFLHKTRTQLLHFTKRVFEIRITKSGHKKPETCDAKSLFSHIHPLRRQLVLLYSWFAYLVAVDSHLWLLLSFLIAPVTQTHTQKKKKSSNMSKIKWLIKTKKWLHKKIKKYGPSTSSFTCFNQFLWSWH